MMLPLVLPSGPRRPELVGFSLAVGVLLSTAIVLISLAFGSGSGWLPGVIVLLVVAAVGSLRLGSMAGPYRLWNRLARRAARIGESWTLAVCYFVIFPIAGRAGSTFPKGELDPAVSAWIQRREPPSAAFASLSDAGEGPGAGTGWVWGLLRWAGASSNLWALTLLPFLILLRSFSHEKDEVRLDTNYTLY